MRLLLTSIQKSGTHQIYPALHDWTHPMPQIVDYSNIDFYDLPEPFNHEQDEPRSHEETLEALRNMPGRGFGHVPHFPEYASMVQSQPTKVLLNVRDPRDVIVSVYFNIKKVRETDPPGYAWLDLKVKGSGDDYLMDRPDPISDLIRIEARRWPHYLAWRDHDFTATVRYEDLRLFPERTVDDIREWLPPHGAPHREGMIRGLSPSFYPTNPTFRRGAVGEYKELFDSHHKRLADKLLGDILDELNYERAMT